MSSSGHRRRPYNATQLIGAFNLVIAGLVIAVMAVAWGVYLRSTSSSTTASAARADRRREMRLEANEPVTVHVLGDSPAAFPGRIVNVSARGMCIVMERALPFDAALLLTFHGCELRAEVRYSVPRGSVFWVGVELREVLTSAEEFLEWLGTLETNAVEGLPAERPVG